MKLINTYLFIFIIYENVVAMSSVYILKVFNSLRAASRWQRHRSCTGPSPLLCTHVSRACKKQLFFEENWMNFQAISILTLNLPLFLRYNSLKLGLLFFLNLSFSKYSGAEWRYFTANWNKKFSLLGALIYEHSIWSYIKFLTSF